jgi:hypothetical protein
VAVSRNQREYGSSVVERKWDTWTRDEILAIRGYSAISQTADDGLSPPDSSITLPASTGLGLGQLAVEGEEAARSFLAVDALEATNGSVAPLSGPVDLSTTKEPPEVINAPHNALQPMERFCSECGGTLPAQSRPDRTTCSPRCAQRRHDRLRKSRESLKSKALQVGTEAAGQVALTGPVPVLEDAKGGQEAGVLELAVDLSTMLPAGWRAEVGPGNIILSWRTG